MDLTVSDADIKVLAEQLTVVMNDAYKQGQQAERERIRARVRLAAISSWSASEVYIGPPLIQLQKFVDRLLEDSDATTE